MKRQMKAVRRGLSGFTFLSPVVRFPDPRDGFSLLKWPKWKLPKKSEGTSKALGPFCLGRGNHLSFQTTSSLLPFFWNPCSLSLKTSIVWFKIKPTHSLTQQVSSHPSFNLQFSKDEVSICPFSGHCCHLSSSSRCWIRWSIVSKSITSILLDTWESIGGELVEELPFEGSRSDQANRAALPTISQNPL